MNVCNMSKLFWTCLDIWASSYAQRSVHWLRQQHLFTWGNVWNTTLWRVVITERRETSIRSLASNILTKDTVAVRKFSRLLGKIRSTADALPLARARCRAMAFDFSSVCKKPEDYSYQFSPSTQAREELEYWASFPIGQSTLISQTGLPTNTVDT